MWHDERNVCLWLVIKKIEKIERLPYTIHCEDWHGDRLIQKPPHSCQHSDPLQVTFHRDGQNDGQIYVQENSLQPHFNSKKKKNDTV